MNIKRNFLKKGICAAAVFLVPFTLYCAAMDRDDPGMPQERQTVAALKIGEAPNPLLGVWSNSELKFYFFDQAMAIFGKDGNGWEFEEAGPFSCSSDEIYFDGMALAYQLSGTNLTLTVEGERFALKKETGKKASLFEGVWRETSEGYAFIFYYDLFIILEPDLRQTEEAALFEYMDKTITFYYDYDEPDLAEYKLLPGNRLRMNISGEWYELKKSDNEKEEASKLSGAWSDDEFKFYFFDQTVIASTKTDTGWGAESGGFFGCFGDKIYIDGDTWTYRLSGTNLTLDIDGDRYTLKKEAAKKASPFEGKWVEPERRIIFAFYQDLCVVFAFDMEGIDGAMVFEYTDKEILVTGYGEPEPTEYTLMSNNRWRWNIDGDLFELKKITYGNF
ncbi:MAG: hypothetical protein LBP29_06955 [Treponema sp.]|jgi:hypothetical protein|nr:hypothetical protein [Treponema sp.]